MQIVLNGKHRLVQEPATVASLLSVLDVAVKGVAVEVNERLIPRRTFDHTPVRDGDRVEVVTLVGGG